MTRGEWMIYLRESKGMSRLDLSKASGVSVNTIRRVEATGSGRTENLIILARALGVPIDQYLDGQPAEPTAYEKGRVEVFVPAGKDREDPNLFLSVNGVGYLLPKGRRLLVPPEVAEEYQRSLREAVRYAAKKKAFQQAAKGESI